MAKKQRLGVIDIGTLKVKLLIAELAPDGSLETKYHSNTLTCLGVRMHENDNRPQPEYLRETIAELKRCQKIFGDQGVTKIRVVSTHAFREMGPVGNEIAKMIKSKVGFEVEIISQREEAELFFRAVIRDFQTSQDLTVLDVGGGSVQLLIGNKKRLKNVYQLKTGAQYLFDVYSPRHTGKDHPTREEIRQMEKYVLEQLAPVPKEIQTPVIYGSSCIIDLFQTIGLPLENYSLSQTHPYKTPVGELEKFLDKIILVPYDQREKTYQFHQKDYMWGIDKAFLNVISVCRRVQSPFVIPSNASISQGLVLGLAQSPY